MKAVLIYQFITNNVRGWHMFNSAGGEYPSVIVCDTSVNVVLNFILSFCWTFYINGLMSWICLQETLKVYPCYVRVMFVCKTIIVRPTSEKNAQMNPIKRIGMLNTLFKFSLCFSYIRGFSAFIIIATKKIFFFLFKRFVHLT